jgi:acetolactate synthase-1/2/3 large subunit
MDRNEIPVDTGAEAFIELLNVNKVDCIFLNPGTDTISIQEALAKFKATGRRTPQVILCPHETVAMAAAHGYFAVTGKPQVVLVHVDVGTQNIGGALHNAQRGRVGVVICAGKSPSNFAGERPGSRSGGMMWWQDQRDQAGIVRNFTKWDYELRFNENAHHVVQRAFQIASAEPCGPVYLTLPGEVLAEKIKSVLILDTAKYSAPVTPQADLDMLTRAAGILATSKDPLIITGNSGRNVSAVASLIELAETIGARVISSGQRMSFPSTHPLRVLGFGSPEHLSRADAVLVIDHDIPYMPAMTRLKPDIKIIQIDIDPIKENMPMWGFPVDMMLHADSSKAIPVLTGLVRSVITSERKALVHERLQKLELQRQRLEIEWHDSALAASQRSPISADWFCQCLGEVIDEDTLIVDEALTSGGSVSRYIKRTKPGTIFGSGGSSLGFGLGASLGVKLAAPDKMVVCLVADGSFLFGCPTPAFWASHVYHLPFLCIIFNNEGYNAVRMLLRNTFGKDNFAEKEPLFSGLDITPSPDYALIARACQAYGEKVEDPVEVTPALKRAMEQVKAGRSALLDVRISGS